MSAVDIIKSVCELAAVILLIIGLFNEKKLVKFEVKLGNWFRNYIAKLYAELSGHMVNENEVYYR